MKKQIRFLIDKLNYYTERYDAGYPEISDKDWDKLYFQLEELEKEHNIYYPDSPTQKIHYEIVSKLNKIEHGHEMLSLAKTKDWNEFLNYFNFKDVIGMLKLDGLTCSLEYQNGKLVKAETRGNGIIGEDILHNAKVIKTIPKQINYLDTLVVDGEIICTDENFKEFSNEYKNSRNFASGSIRLLDSEECSKRKLTFIVWNIIEGFNDENSFLHKLNKVAELGFEIVPYTSSFDWDAKEFLIDQASKYGYPIDGLVGRFDDIEYGKSLGSTGHHSRAAYAFKFYDEEYETILKDIEWTMGRTSVLTPVAIFEPVDDGESVIERASLHNISIMKETLHYPFFGQKIKVFKANQIIPQISWAEEKEDLMDDPILAFSITIPDVCPVCGGPAKIVESDSGVETLICNNPQCEGKLINRLDHFCGKKGLDIKGLSKATLEKLIDWGWLTSIEDIFNLHNFKKDWINKSGFGEKSVSNILNAIENSKKCSLDKFICSLGIPLIGSRASQILEKECGTYENFRNKVDNSFDFSEIDTFGYEINKSILSYDYTIADILFSKYLTIDSKNEEEQDNFLEGKVFCITGKTHIYKNRNELKNYIESCGGKVVGSMSAKVNYLINNDINSTSAKNKSAKNLNIPILSEEDFLALK